MLGDWDQSTKSLRSPAEPPGPGSGPAAPRHAQMASAPKLQLPAHLWITLALTLVTESAGASCLAGGALLVAPRQ